MESKHTPGPWTSHNLEVRSEPNPRCQKWPAGRLIADCYHTPPAGYFDGGENAANARLIAAAPELLEALQAVLRDCVTVSGFPEMGKGRTQQQQDSFDAARDALRKATGREW